MSTPLSVCPPGDTHSLTHSLIEPTHYNTACFTCTILNSC
jgi:hypothetical protein